MQRLHSFWKFSLTSLFTFTALGSHLTAAFAAGPNSPQSVAQTVDRIILKGLAENKITPAEITTDEDFLRRVSLDLTGQLPTARDVTLFGLNPRSSKRAETIDRLLKSEQFARTWARYWRDVIFSRATDQRARLAQGRFEQWLTEHFQKGTSWDKIVTELLTATGDVREKGETALIFAHNGDPKELASETSRIFLGIQIQCANCHDHPTDKWKREQFHQLAAYFPRVRVRPVRMENRIRSWEVVSQDNTPGRRRAFNAEAIMRRFDKNRDGKITKQEAKGTFFERAYERFVDRIDANRDKALSLKELKRAQQFANRARGNTEYYMPDLNDPSSRGKRVDPVFFVGTIATEKGQRDLVRRLTLSELVTSKDNKWFARAFVNRIWAEMLGEGFYMPVDDLGPQRQARFPEALDALANGFVESGYDVKWLFRTIANTKTYQRKIRPRDVSETALPFAAALPTRLRSDQIYDSLRQTLGVTSLSGNRFSRRRPGMGYRGFGGERGQFALLFGFDPSTSQEDITGTVPQALFLMNSPQINNLIRGTGNTRLANILRNYSDDTDALSELYLMVLSRDPSKSELKICKSYIAKVKKREEAYEDILWSLLNSSEFLSKR
ncbi:MAG: hypothetical protein Tsb009_24640 [Planctomycetaceae bacterium]